MRITTPSKLSGSGPKKELNAPGAVLTLSSVTFARPLSASIKPPLLPSTAAITATMPISIIMPWIKSLIAVAIYPPAIT